MCYNNKLNCGSHKIIKDVRRIKYSQKLLKIASLNVFQVDRLGLRFALKLGAELVLESKRIRMLLEEITVDVVKCLLDLGRRQVNKWHWGHLIRDIREIQHCHQENRNEHASSMA